MTASDPALPDAVDGLRARRMPASAVVADLSDPRFRPLGDAFVVDPPAPSAPAVPLRLPLDPAGLAARQASARDVVVLARAVDGAWSPVPWHLDASGAFATGPVPGPGTFVAGLMTTTPCFAAAAETCASRACALETYTGSVAGLPPDLRSDLGADAASACSLATAGAYAGAVASLDAFLSRLSRGLSEGAVPRGVHDDLSWRAVEARSVLAQVPTVDVTGTWTGSLPLASGVRAVALQLHARADGRVLGYAPGSADGIVVTAGRVGLDVLHLTLSVRDLADARDVHLELQVHPARGGDAPLPATASGTVRDGAWTRPASLSLAASGLQERRFTLLGKDDARAEAALAVTGDGTLVAGGFRSSSCDFLACGGEVYAHAEDPVTSRLWLFFRSGDGRAGHVEADFGADLLYRPASWEARSPGEPAVTGDLVGLRATGTTTDHAARALQALGRLADDLQARHDFPQHVAGTPHASIDPSYRHDDTDAAGLLASLAAEVALYDTLDADFRAFANLRSDDPPGLHALGRAPHGIDFSDRRTGTLGGRDIVYRDADTSAPDDGLRYLRFDAAAAVLVGNGYPPEGALPGAWPFRLPFTPTDLRERLVGVSGFVPYGVLGLPGGAGWFRFRFGAGQDAPQVRAMADARVVFVDLAATPRETTVFTDTGTHFLAYRGIDPADTLLDWPLSIQAGDLLGDAPPDDRDPSGTRVVDLSAGTSLGRPVCPYWLLDEGDQARVLQARNAHPYPQELTEPFVCNDLSPDDPGLPRTLTWTLEEGTPAAPGNPAALRFTHLPGDPDGPPAFTYDLLDADGNVLQHGDVAGQDFAVHPDPHWSLTLRPAFGPARSLNVAIRARSPLDARLTLWWDGPGTPVSSVYRPSTGGLEFDCPDDGNDCTDDWSLRPPHCAAVPNLGPCALGDGCTVGSRCNEFGECALGTPVDCDDGDACTIDGCVAMTGICLHTPRNCDDGSPETADYCVTGPGCVHWRDPDQVPECEMASDCDDQDPDTADTCGLGKCTHIAPRGPADGACDPGTDALGFRCNQWLDDEGKELLDACVLRCGLRPMPPWRGCLAHCRDVVASIVTGSCPYGCEFPPVPDGQSAPPNNPLCMETPRPDWCEKTCQVVPDCCDSAADCDDFNPCHEHVCVEGACRFMADPWRCLPSDACHVATCDPISGTCLDQPRDCDDGDPCTQDSCDPGDLVNGPCVHQPIAGCGGGPEGEPAGSDDLPVIEQPDAQVGEDASGGNDVVYSDSSDSPDAPPLCNPEDIGYSLCGQDEIGNWNCLGVGTASCSSPWADDSGTSTPNWATVSLTAPTNLIDAASSVGPTGHVLVGVQTQSSGRLPIQLGVVESGGAIATPRLSQTALAFAASSVPMSHRNLAVLALAPDEALVWGHVALDPAGGSTLAGARLAVDPHSGLFVPRRWNTAECQPVVRPQLPDNQPDAPLWEYVTVESGFNPTLAVDGSALNVLALYGIPGWYGGGGIGATLMTRGCIGDDFTLHQRTIASQTTSTHYWWNSLQAFVLPDGRFGGAWLWSNPIEVASVQFAVFTPQALKNAAAFQVITLSAGTIYEHCPQLPAWCAEPATVDASHPCIRLFPQVPDNRYIPMTVGTFAEPSTLSSMLAISFVVPMDLLNAWVVQLKVDPTGGIASCAVTRTNPPTAALSTIDISDGGSGHQLIGVNNYPGGSDRKIGFLARSHQSWAYEGPSNWSLPTFQFPNEGLVMNGYDTPLPAAPYFTSDFRFDSANCCSDQLVTVMAYDRIRASVDFSRFLVGPFP